MAAKDGFWMSTHTGKRVYPLNLHPNQFCIEDIAMGLSNSSRFSGQGGMYSVAEHCVRGARRAVEAGNKILAFEFLMHDAAEAYMGGDMVKPIVEILDDYRTLRDRIQECIFEKFDLPWPMTDDCKHLDVRMLVTEAAVIFRHDDKWWTQIPVEPFKDEWITYRDRPRITGDKPAVTWTPPLEMEFWHPRMARRLFLETYKQLQEVTCDPSP